MRSFAKSVGMETTISVHYLELQFIMADNSDLQAAVDKTWVEEKRWSNFRDTREQKSNKVLQIKAARRRLSGLTQNEKTAHNKVPLELLARDWLNEQKSSIEMRSYLVENLLPFLVVGLEKLLSEVSQRGLSDDKGENPDFNPINYLAQHLMRNNPRFSNFAEAHPYCRTMHKVSEELKKMAYSIDDNQVAQLKSGIKKRRIERESQESAHALEVQRREGLLKVACGKWVLPNEDGLLLSEVQLAVQSWLDLMSEHSLISILKDLFSQLLSSEGSLVSSEADLVLRLMETGSELPGDVFDSFADHLLVCGMERRRRRLQEQRRALFGSVFGYCDPDKTGVVERLRVLHLFNCFYDSASSDVQDKVHNPRRWPIVEVAEAEDLEEDEERSASTVTASSLSEQEYKDFLSGTADQGEVPTQQEEIPILHVDKASNSQEEKVEAEIERKESGQDPTSPEGSKDITHQSGSSKNNEDTPPAPDTSKNNEDTPPAPDTSKNNEDTPPVPDTSKNNEDTPPAPDTSKNNEDTPPAPVTSTADESGSIRPVGEEEPKPSPRVGSVLERRLATASRYGRSASISTMRRLSGMSSRPVSPSGPGSAWDHFMLNCSQFVQLVELFLGSSDPIDSIVDSLSSFIRENYTETAQERAERLELAQQQILVLTKRQRINSLFEVWDNDRSGYLELEELQLVLGKWKSFSNEQAQEHAKEILLSLGAQQTRLSRASFHMYIEQLTEGMRLRELEEFSEYLMTSVKLTFEELRRGEKRKILLDKIYLAGRASGLQFLQGMKAAISAIHEDVSEFGGGKNCSVSMALLEPTSHTNSSLCLSYKAASSDKASRVVGRKLLRSFKQGVSFTVVDTCRPLCVQNIRRHGRVYFLIPDHNDEEYNGSLVVSPITTPRETVVGTLSVDTVRKVADDGLDTTFLTHEINFHQGVGVCLGEVFHWIEARRKLLKVSQSALSWIHRRCPQVTQAAMYIVEPCKAVAPDKCSYTLRCMLSTSSADQRTEMNKSLVREENMFREYLFQCADNSEPVLANAYGQHHLAYPIRDSTGCAVAVLDFHMPPTQHLRPSQLREVTKVLKLLTLAYYQLSCVPEHAKGVADTPASSRPVTQGSMGLLDNDQDISVLFDQLMLTDLKESVAKLDNRVFAELRSYVVPPSVILGIVQALLYILYPDKDFDTWAKCKQFVTVSLVKDLQTYDPLNLEDKQHKKLDHVKEIIKGIQAGSIQDHGSLPAKYIYGWVNVCLSLLEHAATMPPVNPGRSAGSSRTDTRETTKDADRGESSQSMASSEESTSPTN